MLQLRGNRNLAYIYLFEGIATSLNKYSQHEENLYSSVIFLRTLYWL